MKRLKTSSLLAVTAALFAMALLGPSSAMGETTALCKADQSPCSSPLSHLHYVSEMTLLTSLMTYECELLFLASAGNLGSPQILEGQFTYSSCNQGCERKELNGPAIIEILRTGAETAEVIGTEGEVLSNCSGGLHCVYTLEGLTGSDKGPLLSAPNGEISYVGASLTKVSGFFCPSQTTLDARLAPLSAAYISS